MSLANGSKLGVYEIIAPIGAGGMGEVYRARDPKLKRDVAIKVLPEVFAEDAERMKRFEREAQLLASLNHPHIAAIYGLEQNALILELVEGPTLAERIEEGPLDWEEALRIALHIAEALEYAHDNGIIHRDLGHRDLGNVPRRQAAAVVRGSHFAVGPSRVRAAS